MIPKHRHGQKQLLEFNHNNEFDRINKQLSRIEEWLQDPIYQSKELKAREDWVVDDLILELRAIDNKIKDERDKQSLNQRVIYLMLKIKYKTVRTVFND